MIIQELLRLACQQPTWSDSMQKQVQSLLVRGRFTHTLRCVHGLLEEAARFGVPLSAEGFAEAMRQLTTEARGDERAARSTKKNQLRSAAIAVQPAFAALALHQDPDLGRHMARVSIDAARSGACDAVMLRSVAALERLVPGDRVDMELLPDRLLPNETIVGMAFCVGAEERPDNGRNSIPKTPKQWLATQKNKAIWGPARTWGNLFQLFREATKPSNKCCTWRDVTEWILQTITTASTSLQQLRKHAVLTSPDARRFACTKHIAWVVGCKILMNGLDLRVPTSSEGWQKAMQAWRLAYRSTEEDLPASCGTRDLLGLGFRPDEWRLQ